MLKTTTLLLMVSDTAAAVLKKGKMSMDGKQERGTGTLEEEGLREKMQWKDEWGNVPNPCGASLVCAQVLHMFTSVFV